MLRNSPSTTDVVRDLSWRNNPCVFIGKLRKEHLFEEFFGIRQVSSGEESIGEVDFVHVVGVKLGGNSFDVASEGAWRSGCHPPPVISCLAVDERDEISVCHIIIGSRHCVVTLTAGLTVTDMFEVGVE